MFMRENRRKNGVAQPEHIASAEAAPQRKARKLDPNEILPGGPDDYRFTPDMSTCTAINNAHYEGGVSGAGPYVKSYEDKIPYVGALPNQTHGKLRKEP